MELLALTVITVVLLVERHLRERSARQERDAYLTQLEHERIAAQQERAALLEAAADERRELLTRIQHPQLIVEKHDPAPQQVVEEEDDDWGKVGTVLPLVEPELEPED